MTRARPVPQVLLSLAGLTVWAGHFTAIYAVTSFACERGIAGQRLFGLGLVPALVGIATIAALALLALAMRPALRNRGAPLTEGGEDEPRFTAWFGAVTAALAALAVVFQSIPVLLLPGCG